MSGLTAAVERAHSDRARSGSKRPTRVLFRLLYRARSASKKGLATPWPLLQSAEEGVPREAQEREGAQFIFLDCSGSDRVNDFDGRITLNSSHW